MAGGTAAHAQLIVALLAALRVHLGNRGPCRVYPSDMKLRTLENEYSPDAYLACGETGPNQRRLEDAILICKVRSQSTAEFDREEKFEDYKVLSGLREYLILDNRRPQAILHLALPHSALLHDHPPAMPYEDATRRWGGSRTDAPAWMR